MDSAPKRKIISTTDFQKMLADALAIVKELEVRSPGFAVYESIRLQLEALTQWTANGRRPTAEEEQRITLGVIAVRELEDDSRPEVQKLSQLLMSINYELDGLTGASEICEAVDKGDRAEVRRLLDQGVSANSRGSIRASALELASANGNFELVELLMSRGARATNQALQWAVQKGDARIVQKLLAQGAEATSKDSNGVAPLFFAVCGGSTDLTGFLLDPIKKRPKPTKPPKDEYRILIQMLAEKGADVNEKFLGSNYKPGFGTTPLMVAAAFGCDDNYQYLLYLGADPGIQDAMNRTVADWKRAAS
jgi:ankyrin repeat protein